MFLLSNYIGKDALELLYIRRNALLAASMLQTSISVCMIAADIGIVVQVNINGFGRICFTLIALVLLALGFVGLRLCQELSTSYKPPLRAQISITNTTNISNPIYDGSVWSTEHRDHQPQVVTPDLLAGGVGNLLPQTGGYSRQSLDAVDELPFTTPPTTPSALSLTTLPFASPIDATPPNIKPQQET